MRWDEPISGIPRVQRLLAGWALRHRPDIDFAVFSPERQAFVGLVRAWCPAILAGELRVEQERPRSRWRRWLKRPNKELFLSLERLRLARRGEGWRRAIARLQRPLLNAKRRDSYYDDKGRRATVVASEALYSGVLDLGPGDRIVLTGLDMYVPGFGDYIATKRTRGFGVVLLCHDLIPLRQPQLVRAPDREMFARYLHQVLPCADRVLAVSRFVGEDVAAYCREQGWAVPPLRIIALPNFTRDGDPAPTLPAGLSAGRYALYVSVLGARKNHELLLRAWARLRGRGLVPDFKLVFVGKPARDMEALAARLSDPGAADEGIVWLRGVSDALLLRLYRDAAFCLYPSLVEGYGLPLAEAFAQGKAVIASTGGSLPEVAGEFSPCLDPTDLEAWTAMMERWILDPAARAPYEQAIRARYRPISPDEAGERFFAALDGLNSADRSG